MMPIKGLQTLYIEVVKGSNLASRPNFGKPELTLNSSN